MVAWVLVVLWSPVLYPGGKAALLLLDVYSPVFAGRNLAEAITPEPRSWETREIFAGRIMRVSWWRPGWGDRHPAVMLVNGATPLGNDNLATQQISRSLARAGYLVMLPEFPAIKEARLDPAVVLEVDEAFRSLRRCPECDGRAGAFGFSVGGGILLAAAGSREAAVDTASFIAVLGGYFDVDTYLASVVTAAHEVDGRIEPWEPGTEVRQRLPLGVMGLVRDDEDRKLIETALARQPVPLAEMPPDEIGAEGRLMWGVLSARSYEAAVARSNSLPPPTRVAFDRLSPQASWERISPTIFWIHDPADTFEPLAEAKAAAAAKREGRMVLVVPRLIAHAQVAEQAKSEGLAFWVSELWALLTFTIEVLRLAG